MMAMAFVTIGDLFPPAERGKYQGIIAGVFGVSSVIGPTLGGFLTDALSWHWIFFVNLPLGIPVVFLFIKLFPNRKPARARKIDLPGAALLVLAIVPGLIGLSWGGVQYAWDSVQVIGALAISLIAGIAFVFTELRVASASHERSPKARSRVKPRHSPYRKPAASARSTYPCPSS